MLCHGALVPKLSFFCAPHDAVSGLKPCTLQRGFERTESIRPQFRWCFPQRFWVASAKKKIEEDCTKFQGKGMRKVVRKVVRKRCERDAKAMRKGCERWCESFFSAKGKLSHYLSQNFRTPFACFLCAFRLPFALMEPRPFTTPPISTSAHLFNLCINNPGLTPNSSLEIGYRPRFLKAGI